MSVRRAPRSLATAGGGRAGTDELPGGGGAGGGPAPPKPGMGGGGGGGGGGGPAMLPNAREEFVDVSGSS